MRSWLVSGLLSVLVGAASAVTLANDYVIAGSAYNISNGKLLYRELYTNIDMDKNVTVDYTTPEGDVFATKKLSYRGEVFQPEFEYKDLRDNDTSYARFEGPHLIAGFTVKYSRQEKTFINNANIVIDAGYDAFIQLNWDAVSHGKRVEFQHLLAGQLETMTIEARKIKASDSPLYDREIGRDWLYLRLKPTKRLSKIFADPVYLAYDPRGRYLMRYQGKAFIDDENNVPWYVRIDYQYSN